MATKEKTYAKKVIPVKVSITPRDTQELNAWLNFDGIDYFIPCNEQTSKVATNGKELDLSTNPQLVEAIINSEYKHQFYVEEKRVADGYARDVAHANIGEYPVNR